MRKISSRFLSALLLSAFAGIMISGCSNTTPPPINNTPANVTPKDSSTYIYNRHEVDSTSGKPATSPQDTLITAVVVSSGKSFQGKNNVVTVYDDFDTLRYSVESNNDISFYRASFGSNGFIFKNPSPWLTLPFGTKLVNDTLFSTKDSISVQGTQEYLLIVGVADYLGTDEIDTGKTPVKLASGNQVRLRIIITGTKPLPISGISSTQTYSFDGSIGNYFHSIANTIFPDVVLAGFRGSTTLTTKTLVTYHLK
jgi:hypothetical protein